jgi:hypothetical protein
MGNEESKYHKELHEIKNSLHDLLNLKNTTKIIAKRREKIDKDRIKPSGVKKQLKNPAMIPLILEALNRCKKDYISSYNNIDIAKSIFNSNIYFENPKSKNKDTSEEEYYSEQIKLIDDLNEGNLFCTFEDEIVEKEKTEIDKEENGHEMEEEEEEEMRPKKETKAKKSLKINENETYLNIKKKNEEFLRKVSSKKEIQKIKQDLERPNNISLQKTAKHQAAFEDLSIEEYLKKESKRIKSIYGHDFLNEAKPNDPNTDDTSSFDMRKNKHLEAIYSSKHPDKLIQNKQDNFKNHKGNTKYSQDNDSRKNGDNTINKSLISNNKSVITNPKQINIKIDLSKYIPPENANKSFTTKTKSLSPGVRINYYDKSPTNTKGKNKGNLIVSNQENSRDNSYTYSTQKGNKYINSLGKNNGIITSL